MKLFLSQAIIAINLLFWPMLSIAQPIDSVELNQLVGLSMADMLKVEVQVASTVPKKINEISSVVSIIDRQTIERYSFQNIAEALLAVAGVDVLQTNLDRNVVNIRGILQNYYNNKILILINNTPVWQAIYGNASIDRVNINDVERIEVLKGPASVLYGTNAYMGVINIILRTAEKNALHARVEAGLPSRGSAAVNYSTQRGDFSAFISGSSSMSATNLQQTIGAADSTLIGKTYQYQKDTSFFAINEKRNYSFNTELRYKSHCLFLNDYSDIFTYSGVNISYATGSRWPFINKGTLLGYKFTNQLTNSLNLFVTSYYDYFSRYYNQTADGSSAIHFSTGRAAAVAKINYQINKQASLEIGADVQRGHNFGHFTTNTKTDTIVSTNLMSDNDLIEWSGFGQIHYNTAGLFLLAGTRYTGNRTFGANISSQTSVAYSFNETHRIKVGYGQSYRTPTLLELYFKHYTVVGNSQLKPERNNTLEASYVFSIENLYLQSTLFYAQYRNLIQRVPRPGLPAEYRNVAQFDGAGGEIECKYMNTKVANVLLNYSYLKGVGENSESNFQFIPQHSSMLCVDRAFGRFFTSFIVRSYSETKGMQATIPAQYNFGVHFGYRHQNEKKIKLTHTISFENITNSQMLTPEYIRRRSNINSQAGALDGRNVYYCLNISF